MGSLPDLSEEEVAEIDRVGSTVHFRAFVSTCMKCIYAVSLIGDLMQAKWIDEKA